MDSRTAATSTHSCVLPLPPGFPDGEPAVILALKCTGGYGLGVGVIQEKVVAVA